MKKTFRIKNVVEGEKKVEPMLKFRYANIESIEEDKPVNSNAVKDLQDAFSSIKPNERVLGTYDEPGPTPSKYGYTTLNSWKFGADYSYDTTDLSTYAAPKRTEYFDPKSYEMSDSLKKTIEDMRKMYIRDENLGTARLATSEEIKKYENTEGN